MTAEHRATDGPRQGLFWVWARRLYRVWVALVPAIAVAAALIAVVQTRDTVEDVAKIQEAQIAEGLDRRDETCVAFERDTQAAASAYRDARRAYERSTEFLERVPDNEAETFLIRAVREGIPRLRAEVHQRHEQAKAAAAPPYCDEDQVGLPEPNPRLPDQALP